MNPTDFSDLDDLDTAPIRDVNDLSDLDDLDSARTKPGRRDAPAIPCPTCFGKKTVIKYGYRRNFVNTCPTCRGSGTVRGDYKVRQERRQKRKAREANDLAQQVQTWKQENPTEWTWMEQASERGFEFAASLRGALEKYGHLTDRQLEAVRSAAAKSSARQAERQAQQEARNADVGPGAQTILETLRVASGNGLKRPTLRTEQISFSLAKTTSKNAGCVYVKSRPDREAMTEATYLGKITEAGIFQPVRDCSEEHRAQVLQVAQNPLEAAIKYGRITGNCSCCGRRLDRKDSIERGIGPICAEKFGWSA